ncbi:hypothetical protein [Sphingomonas sp. Leaf339]|uniref:hypothetical protein n=1 Tax=Sphingomonas sp. Leaf339 TaxID=1736343 RepID=UPI001F1B5448|nr:hypothetical protein [Sphingomonas sp. Leaf339]
MSAASRRASRAGMAFGVSPIEGPCATMIGVPVVRRYDAAKLSNAALNPPDVKTVRAGRADGGVNDGGAIVWQPTSNGASIMPIAPIRRRRGKPCEPSRLNGIACVIIVLLRAAPGAILRRGNLSVDALAVTRIRSAATGCIKCNDR